MNNIVIFATYWNEIKWIKASLAQIEKINPKEMILCDGCFDPNIPNYSTDGTREILQDFVSKTDNARMISAIRLSLLQHYLSWFKPLPHEKSITGAMAKLRTAKRFHRINLYRLNQMATFNYMIKISKEFKVGNWFMTYDSDQFYSDSMIDLFKYVNDKDISYNLISGKEYTFFESYDNFTESYDKRDYNNMPHRAFEDTRFIPTRHPARIIDSRYKIYSDFESKKFAGIYYHYKFGTKERINAGYSLGDRKSPQENLKISKLFKGKHPEIIKKFFL